MESKQDMPQWLEALAIEGRYSVSQRKTPTRRYVRLINCLFMLDTEIFCDVVERE